MPSGWDVYAIVFLSALIALGLPLALAVVSRLLSSIKAVGRASGPKPLNPPHSPPPLTPFGPFSTMNTRFFLGVNAALALVALVLILVPCAVVIRNAAGDPEIVLRSLIAILSVAGFTGLGLLYCARKGDLSWIHSFQSQSQVDLKNDEHGRK